MSGVLVLIGVLTLCAIEITGQCLDWRDKRRYQQRMKRTKSLTWNVQPERKNNGR